MRIHYAVIGCLIQALLLVSSSHADVMITYSNPVNQDEDMVLTVAGNRAAMNVPGPGGKSGRMIYDRGADKLFMVMDEKMQYMDLEVMMQSLGGLSDMLAGMMENMPEDQRAQLGGVMGNLGGQQAQPVAPPEITSTGETATVAGVNCSIQTMKAAGNTTEVCLASPGDVGISDGDFAILQAMMKKQAGTARQAGQMLGIQGLEFSPGELDGVPLRIKQLTGPEAGTTSELKDTSNEVDPSAVAIPESYQPVTMMGG